MMQKRHAMDLLFALALFCVLTASALSVMLIGVRVYKQIVEDMNSSYDVRTSLSYIGQKVRQNDAAGTLYTGEFGDGSALFLEQESGGQVYRSILYTSGGYLRELLVAQDAQPAPEDGQEILPVQSLSIEPLGGGLLRIAVRTGEQERTNSMILAPRGGMGAPQ